MANLAKSNTIWLQFWVRFLFVLSVFRYLDFVLRRFGDESRTLVEVIDPRGNLDMAGGGVTLDGVIVGTNTTAAGEIIVRVTGAGDPRTVTFYKAVGAGAGDRICAGDANAGAVATLTELNDSGVTATYDIDATVTADTDDTHVLRVRQDWRLAATNVFNGTDDEGEDGKSLQTAQNELDEIEGLLFDARAIAVGWLVRIMLADENNARAYGSKFLGERLTSLLLDRATVDGSGLVTRVRTGGAESLRLAMVDEATGSTQTVVRRIVAAAAGVAQTGNDGLFTLASHTPEAQMPTGTVILRAINGKEQGFPGAVVREQFSVEFASDETDETKVYTEPLTVGVAYKGPDGFGGSQGLTMVRSLTKTGDNSHLNLATVASGFAAAGESLLNTTSGVIYWEVTGSAGAWVTDWYSADTRLASEKIATSPAAAEGAAFAAAAVNASGFSFTGTIGSAPVTGTEGSVDLNFASTQNTQGKPDEFRIAVTLTETGEISRVLQRMPILAGNGYRLNGAALGAELIADTYVERNTYTEVTGA